MSNRSTKLPVREDNAWPEGLTRVPYWVFQREDVYRLEQERLFQGECWSYLCLEADVV